MKIIFAKTLNAFDNEYCRPNEKKANKSLKDKWIAPETFGMPSFMSSAPQDISTVAEIVRDGG